MMLLFLLYIIGISTVLINIFEPRTFDIFQSFDILSYPLIIESQAIASITIITKVIFISISVLLFFWGLVKRNFHLPKQGLTLTLAGLSLFIPAIISSLLSKNGGFSYQLLYFPIFVITAYIIPRFATTRNVNNLPPVLLIIIYSSLLSILINPNWAFSSYSESWIGLPIRLFGTLSHPNGLGYVALAYIILARLDKKHTFWKYINLFAAVVVIILAQSKTAWIALIVWLLLTWVLQRLTTRKQQISQIIAFLLVFLLIVATFLFVIQKDFFVSQNLTFSGRIYVWKISFDTWLDNPVFGYGPGFWTTYFRQDYGYLWAGQAHNQFLQSLGESGILGFAGLVFYLVTIIRIGSRTIDVTNFATFGIVIAILIRSFFETPLKTYGLDQSFLVHAIFWLVLLNSQKMIQVPKKSTKVTQSTNTNLKKTNEQTNLNL